MQSILDVQRLLKKNHSFVKFLIGKSHKNQILCYRVKSKYATEIAYLIHSYLKIYTDNLMLYLFVTSNC